MYSLLRTRCCVNQLVAIPGSKSVGRNSRTHQTNQQNRQLFCDGLPRSVHEFSHVFIRSGGWESPWARLVCKWKFTIPEAGKPLINLCFPQCSFLVSYFKFPLPFSLTENRISQPYVVPTFQPSQKSTNKREALNKKIYYVAPRLHSTMPVGGLM